MIKINKNEFDKLEIINQVEYINENLKIKSITTLCDEIGIGRTTLRNRFKKNNFEFDKSRKKYILNLMNNAKSNAVINTNNNTNILEYKISALESKIESLEGKINSVISARPHPINKNQETVSRCYRIYEDVQKEFSEFCKNNKEYKVQDLMSQALKEFMDRHKNS